MDLLIQKKFVVVPHQITKCNTGFMLNIDNFSCEISQGNYHSLGLLQFYPFYSNDQIQIIVVSFFDMGQQPRLCAKRIVQNVQEVYSINLQLQVGIGKSKIINEKNNAEKGKSQENSGDAIYSTIYYLCLPQFKKDDFGLTQKKIYQIYLTFFTITFQMIYITYQI